MPTVDCVHINEDGSYVVNEDGGYNVLETCVDAIIGGQTPAPTGGGYGAREDAVARYARLRTIIADDDDALFLLVN